MQGQLLWRGPRVRMGMFEGQPVAVVPHPASGRADYFGTLCNRWLPVSSSCADPGRGRDAGCLSEDPGSLRRLHPVHCCVSPASCMLGCRRGPAASHMPLAGRTALPRSATATLCHWRAGSGVL